MSAGPFSAADTQGCTAQVLGQPGDLAANSSGNLALRIVPSQTQWSCRISGSTSDAQRNPYAWIITGSATAQVSSVVLRSGGATGAAIFNGAVDPAPRGVIGLAQRQTYALANLGSGALTVGPFALSSASGATLVSAQVTPPGPIAPGAQTELAIQLRPNSATWSLTLTGPSNDAGRPILTWTLAGNAANPPTIPWPAVRLQRLAEIPDGSSDALGEFALGASTAIVYTWTNTGSADLALGPFLVASPVACQAQIPVQPVALLTPGATTAMTVVITPAGTAWSCRLSGVTNAPGHSFYAWTVTGTAPAAAAPRLWVGLDGRDISAGGNLTVANGTQGVAQSVEFQVLNQGQAPLTLSEGQANGSGCTSILHNAAAGSLANGISRTVRLTITPTTSTWQVLVTLNSNDPQRGQVQWMLRGSAATTSTGGQPPMAGTESGLGGGGGGGGCATGGILGLFLSVSALLIGRLPSIAHTKRWKRSK